MSIEKIYEDQPKRNTLGFDITCQVQALLEMLRREQRSHDDMQSFGDLLDAIMPRLQSLNDAAMALFTDVNAVTSGELIQTVYGRGEKGEPS